MGIISILLVVFFLPETLPSHSSNSGNEKTPLLNSNNINSNEGENKNQNKKKGILSAFLDKELYTKRTFVFLIINCFLWVSFIVFDETFGLWSKASKKEGGLAFNTTEVGIFFLAFGVEIVLYATLVWPKLSTMMSMQKLLVLGEVKLLYWYYQLYHYCNPISY